jgi:hypothetical protein
MGIGRKFFDKAGRKCAGNAQFQRVFTL